MDKKISKNFVFNFIYQLTSVITPLLTTPYTSRVLRSYGIGVYSYTNAIAIGFSLFAALGVNNYGQREIAYYQEDIYKRSLIFMELMFIRGGISGVVLAIYCIFSFCYKTYTIYLLQQMFIIIGVMFDISWFFSGIEDFKKIAVRNVAVKSVMIFLIFAFVKTESDIGRYILINSITTLLGNIMLWMGLRKVIVRVPFKQLYFRRHIKGVIELFVPLIAVQIYSQLDKVMLGILADNIHESGYYEEARKLISAPIALLVSINTVLLPRVSNLYAHQQKEQIIKLYKESTSILLMMLIPAMAGMVIISNNLVAWFLGSDFMKVAYLLKLSVPMLLFMAIGNFVGIQYLIPTGQQNIMTIIYICSAVINVLLNFLLIPTLYSEGALIASCIAEVFSGSFQLVLLKRSEFNFSVCKGVWKYLISAIIMYIVLFIMDKNVNSSGIQYTLIQIVIGIIVYLTMLIVLQVKEVQKLKRIFSNLK